VTVFFPLSYDQRSVMQALFIEPRCDVTTPTSAPIVRESSGNAPDDRRTFALTTVSSLYGIKFYVSFFNALMTQSFLKR